MNSVKDAELYDRLRDVLDIGTYEIPDREGFGGTGAPGILLEELLGLKGGNSDTPDAGKWEIKFHSRSAPLTLFHLEADPKNHMRHMVQAFGWPDKNGRTSFRHTIWGKSDRGFYVANESEQITVRHSEEADIVWPHWRHDKLMNAFAAKLRRLIAVKGERLKIHGVKHVNYSSARLFWEPKISLFADAVENGIVAIDFDARTNNGSGLRNHGTKFRIRYEDLEHIYANSKKFE